jgi:hypothetical protein
MRRWPGCRAEVDDILAILFQLNQRGITIIMIEAHHAR